MDKHEILETIRNRPEVKATARGLARIHHDFEVQSYTETETPYHRCYSDAGMVIDSNRGRARHYAISRMLTDPRTSIGRGFLCDWAMENDPRFEILPFDDHAPEDMKRCAVSFRSPWDHSSGRYIVRTVDVDPIQGETPQDAINTCREMFWQEPVIRWPRDSTIAARILLTELGRILEAMEKTEGLPETSERG